MGKKILKYGWVWILTLGYSYGLLAQSIQVSATASNNKILIGEPIEIMLNASLPPGSPIAWLSADTIPHFEYLKKGEPVLNNSAQQNTFSQKITITSYDSGRWQLPAFIFESGNKSYTTTPITIDVAYTPFDTNKDYNDIKDIVEVKAPALDWIKWLLLVIGLTAALAAYLLLRKKKTISADAVSSKSLLPPYEAALQEMNLLQQGWKSNNPKTNYSQLNDIIRNYLKRKAGIAGLQQTNTEWIKQLPTKGLPFEELSTLSTLLQQADAIKFAKWLPDEPAQQKDIQQARHSLQVLENLFNKHTQTN